MKRKSLSARVRFDVFKRDAFVCQYCGAHPPEVLLEVDHIIPVAEGGDNEEVNLITSCVLCNRGKGAVPLSVTPLTIAEKSAQITERESQLAGYREIMQARADRIESDAWTVAEELIDGAEAGFRRDWLASIKHFNSKLDLHEVMEAAAIARVRKAGNQNNLFRYFCGICWKKVKDGAQHG